MVIPCPLGSDDSDSHPRRPPAAGFQWVLRYQNHRCPSNVPVEAVGFTERIIELGADDNLRELEERLATNPNLGDRIQGMDGLRKVRMSLPGRGKRGAARILYLLFVTGETIFFLIVYTKNGFEDLPDEVKSKIRKRVSVIRREYEHEDSRLSN